MVRSSTATTATTDKKRKDRLKHISDLCGSLNKSKWGGESGDAVHFLGGSGDRTVKKLPTGSRKLDEALDGGWPFGRICELFGPESGGKSTLCLHAIQSFQTIYPNEDVAIIDSEHSLDPEYAKKLNVDLETLIVHQPDSGEQALNILELMIVGGVGLIIVDSVAALVPQHELDGDIGDTHVALQARLMSQALRRLTGQISKANAIVLFTNQIRDKIGVTWGDKTTTSGGRALRFYASSRVEIVRIGSIKDGEVAVSNKVKATVKKSKCSPPYRIANFNITFGVGVDSAGELLADAIDKKIIKKAGSWFSYGETQIGQGTMLVLDFLRENPDIATEIDIKCRELSETPKERKARVVEPEPEDDEQDTQEENTKVEVEVI